MKFNNTKITSKITGQYFYFLLIIFIAIILSCLFLFLYKNFYKVIIQAKEIVILEEKVSVKTIDMNEFNKIIDKLNKKIIMPKIISNLNNSFD